MIFISSQMSPFVVDGGSIHSVNLTVGTLKPFAPIPRLFCSSFKNSERDGTDSITLRDSSFSSFELDSAPFFALNASCFVKVSGLMMGNISIASDAQREMDLRARTETTIEGCSFFSVWDVIDGGIARSVNSPCTSLKATNSSFECCFRTTNVNETGRRNMTRQVLGADETNVFTDCEWCNTSASYGCAIYLYGSSTLECIRCSFMNMSHGGDGAVDVQSGAGVIMSGCNFTNCISNANTGGMIIYRIIGDYFFSECFFFECKSVSQFAGGLRICHNVGNMHATIEKCKLIRNEAAFFGGGLYIELQESPYFISECEFEGNLANGTGTESFEGGGGGMFMYSTSWMQTDSTPERISFCFFSRNKAKIEEGNDVKIKNEYLKGSLFKSSFSTTSSRRVFYKNSQTDYDGWLPTIRTAYARADGITWTVCGTTQTNPCNTIEQAFNMIEKGAEGTVNILRSSYSSKALFIEGGDISFKGESESDCIISTKLLNSHECLFTLDSGSMGLSLVAIRHDSAESSSSLFTMRTAAQKLTLKNVIISREDDGQVHSFDSSPFKVIFEKLMMENCLIEDICLGDCSLFEEEEESGVVRGMLENVTIQRISRMRGDGAIFSSQSERSNFCELENTIFRNCVCKEGNGGSVAWRVDDSGIFKIGRGEVTTVIGECVAEKGSGDEKGRGGGMYLELSSPSIEFEIVNVGFENNHAEHGVNVFIASNQLELIPKGRYGFVSLLSEDVQDVEGAGDTSNETLVIPIVCYLLEVPRSEIYVSASGADHPRCGHTFFECRTLSYPIEREENIQADGTTTATIKVGNGVEVSSTVVFSKMARMIEGTEDDGSLVVEGDASCNGDEEGCVGVFVVLKETRMRKIGLVTPSMLEHQDAIFQLKGETLNLSECVFAFGVGIEVSYVGYNLIVVEKGEANVTSLRLDSVRFGKPGIRANGGLSSVSLKNVELNDMTLEGEMGFVVCEGGSTLTAESVIASGCEIGGRSLILAGSNCIARMRGCKWSSCNFVDSGVIKGSGAKEISILGCNGSNIRVSEGDGGMMNGVVGEGGMVDVQNTSVEGCVAGRGNGGGMCVAAEENAFLNVNGGLMKECNAEEENVGKGGWLYVNCSERKERTPFQLEGVKFAGNEAFVGKNMFILDSDLNVTVRSETFAIDVEGMEDDPNAFVGSDEKRINTDLLRFVIEYKSERIVVWEKGDDVVRCGSEEDPCETLEMGMRHMEREGERKVVGVKEKIRVEGEYDLSGIEVESVGAGFEEMEYGTVVLGSEGESGAKVCLRNSGAFTLRALEMDVMNVLGSEESGMIVSEGEKVEWEDCSITWKGKREGMGDVAFCVVKKGGLEVKRFKVLSYFGKRSAFVVGGEVVSVNDEFTVIEATLEKGSLFEIEGEGANGGGEMRMKNCSIGSVEGEGADPSIVSSKSGNGVKLVVEDSLIELCSCGRSTKGGAMLFELNEGGLFDVVNTSVKQCGCSVREGKGGGVYLKTELRGELDYVFDGVIFRKNTAFIGNDVFIVCDCIKRQINEAQFNIDFLDGEFIRQNAIFGMDAGEHKEEAMDLMSLIVKYQSDTIVVSNKEGKGGSNEQQCGKHSIPCATIGFGLRHLTHDFFSQMFVDEESVIDEEIGLDTLTLSGMHEVQSRVVVKGKMNCSKEMIAETNGQVYVRWIQFAFEEVESTQTPLPTKHSSFMKIISGKTSISMCSFEGVSSAGEEMVEVPFILIFVERGKCSMGNVSVMWLSFLSEAAMIMEEDTEVSGLTLRNIERRKNCLKIRGAGNARMEKGWKERANEDGAEMNNIEESEFSFSILSSSFENVTCVDGSAGVVDAEGRDINVEFSNCSFCGCSSSKKKGKLMYLLRCKNIQMKQCLFDGKESENPSNEEVNACKWNGSLVEVKESSEEIKDTSFVNCSDGGLSICGGSVKIDDCKFENNSPSIEKYPSIRRNVICSDSGTLNVMSLKGGDGLERNTSLWMLNEGCSFEGIVSERDSSFFIPILEGVEAKEETDRMKLIFKGLLFVPCNLSFSVVKSFGEEKEIEKHDFDTDGFLSEREAEGSVAKDIISNCGNEIEVKVCILFGDAKDPSSTDSFILKNRSDPKVNGDERIAEGGKEVKISWAVIFAVIFAVLFLIVLIIAVAFIVRWKKSKRRTEELQEIVNDNIRKDPKAFEMITMEMSPEEQWRRAEREAEKKNEERMKKRVFEKSLGHSESSEHLLSESDSTEYILGKNSDKIPDWALEKEEEEEIQKRSPSPSISSTCSTDSDSTFVRREDLCPTTSSMSNLVDAMACSSPQEKLIVDLRDSLFMLLHGKNEKKEMAIGTLQEREQTAAQILFWVANLALHSFDEMDNPLQSLANLSPHIVLFSEHMVICIVMHSDFLSDDDSDSSSISSSTVVTSASDDDGSDSLPSSAFEDEDYYKKECLRWKAPELLINKKMGATKESVAFSIGMMLWECLTLQIPFGEYEAETAGQKIINGERPNLFSIETIYLQLIKRSLATQANTRPTLIEIKRIFISHAPAGAVQLTMSDAIDLQYYVDDKGCSFERSSSLTVRE
ncbi:uncharacterized protein MONOS_1055 [Monocercomonoides exilis]|uniref:uncharacterized protein n=1 Tax=Monocercomonoides exilis TaxID=2049356 RepID=UPI00355A8F14|nr:hypothetical protein MONOS_1055 [Monocercomonoides exilis]|eukprot:MONOS_1055.1-p1 / transcript=MONOS_1055.1 / gene=MONOS_1055 / organism=Monocercomonoides_exilis_PA203 / gene_product=unspecified product / transcript_product=unspecified product / location=Mono_scaffold00018:9933-17564(-) / protein_length=2544 / sequence_SO=supercontig / SO=protein_coding / is_pseudo=false